MSYKIKSIKCQLCLKQFAVTNINISFNDAVTMIWSEQSSVSYMPRHVYDIIVPTFFRFRREKKLCSTNERMWERRTPSTVK